MSTSRWKYKTDTVTVGENSQKVRQLTAGERRQFAESSKKVAKGEMEAGELPALVAKFGCIDPVLTQEDADSMPGDLLTACVDKIMELTGLKSKDDGEDAGEKKEPQLSSIPTTSGAAASH